MDHERTGIKNFFFHASRFFALVTAVYGLPQLLYFLHGGFFFGDQIAERWRIMLKIVCTVLPFLLFYTFMRIDFICDDDLQNRVGKKRFKTMICEKSLLFKTGIWLLLLIALPLPIFSRALAELTGIGMDFSPKLLLLAPIAALFLLFTAAAYFSAGTYRRKKGKPQNCDKLYDKLCIRALLIYLFGATGLLMVVPLLFTIGQALLNKTVGKIALTIAFFLILFLCIRLLRQITKRKKLIKGLKKACADMGWILTPVKAPYRSLFFFQNGESFEITRGDESYSCKILSGRKKSVPIMITAGGECRYLHQFHIRKVKIFSYAVNRPIDYKTDKARILIISPVPSYVLGAERAKITELDNGTRIGCYKVYSGNAFLNALLRDCLDR